VTISANMQTGTTAVALDALWKEVKAMNLTQPTGSGQPVLKGDGKAH